MLVDFYAMTGVNLDGIHVTIHGTPYIPAPAGSVMGKDEMIVGSITIAPYHPICQNSCDFPVYFMIFMACTQCSHSQLVLGSGYISHHSHFGGVWDPLKNK